VPRLYFDFFMLFRPRSVQKSVSKRSLIDVSAVDGDALKRQKLEGEGTDTGGVLGRYCIVCA
jgi:hypothetical protein